MLISNRTDRVLLPIDSKTSLSTSPVGIGAGGVGDKGRAVEVGDVATKSRGIGGRILALVGDCERGVVSSAIGVAGVAPFKS